MKAAGAPVAVDGRVVIVGASLAGLRGAEALRAGGFAGQTMLAQMRDIDAEWLLGVPAAGLDLPGRAVELASGRRVGFDRLLIATGTRARPWPDPAQATLDGVFVVRTRDDSARLAARLAAGPRRVLVIGGGFTGSEVASACRELGLAVTLAERSAAPLAGALGAAAGAVAARWHREHGVDLRCNVTVMALEGDATARLRRARLSDGDTLDVDVAVVALGAVRNVEWLSGAGLAADERGVVCDGACRAFDANGIVTDDIFVAGDVARWPHPLFDGQLLAVEHWGNAIAQAATAAHNMICAPSARRLHKPLPVFWSNQFGVNIKSVGLPTIADEIVLTQGTVAERRCAAAYGQRGRLVAAVTVNMPRWLEAYRALIEAGAQFPPHLNAADGPAGLQPIPAGFPATGQATHSSVTTSTGPGPSSSPASQMPAPPSAAPDPRLAPSGTPLDDPQAITSGQAVPAPRPASRPAETSTKGRRP